MDNRSTIVTDPFQREVYLPPGLCGGNDPGTPADHNYDAYSKVIETPACIIETEDAHFYYFRAVGWNLTILIETARLDERWTAVDCRKNPDTDYIGCLLRKGKFIAGESLD